MASGAAVRRRACEGPRCDFLFDDDAALNGPTRVVSRGGRRARRGRAASSTAAAPRLAGAGVGVLPPPPRSAPRRSPSAVLRVCSLVALSPCGLRGNESATGRCCLQAVASRGLRSGLRASARTPSKAAARSESHLSYLKSARSRPAMLARRRGRGGGRPRSICAGGRCGPSQTWCQSALFGSSLLRCAAGRGTAALTRVRATVDMSAVSYEAVRCLLELLQRVGDK